MVVGGGSAGWMTAAMMIKEYPEKIITVIESPNVPKIGVGESTYDGINYYLEYLGIDRSDFFKFTDASIKLGLEFVDFYQKDGNNFYYPFGIPYVDETRWQMQDWMIRKSIYKDIDNKDFTESYFPAAHLIKYNVFNENLDGAMENFDPVIHTAFHFDAFKFGEWLKERYCLPKGVKNIIAEVVNAKVLEDRTIDFIILDDGSSIHADLFIDCTGFQSLLLGKFLNEPFISYQDQLPNNKAWATQISYKDKEKELDSLTRCTAIGNGWTWNIPLYSRLGAGYVYSNEFITDEQALQEFKQYLSSDYMSVKRNKKEIEKLSFKNINMRVGIHKNTWVGNTVAIGLSAAFVEPLESTGLFTVHEFLFQLIRSMSREEVTSWDIYTYNKSVDRLYKSVIEFIKIHYALSIRLDTDYWIKNSQKKYENHRVPPEEYESLYTLGLSKNKTRDHLPHHLGGFPTGITCISVGMNYPVLDSIASKIGEIYNKEKYKETMTCWFDKLDDKKNRWDEIAKNSPKLIDYLKDKYYNA